MRVQNPLRTPLLLTLALPLFLGCATRDLWQQPQSVIDKLDIVPGASVADIGAGDGYFLPYLSKAVGPEGRVYAVDVDEEKIASLKQLVDDERFTNVEVVLAPFDDPALPDGEIDLVLIVNTYHHIEDRPDYFRRLRSDLSYTGRIAVLEPNEDAGGVVSLFITEGHTSSAPRVREEMREAGYEAIASYDFVAPQIFEVFIPREAEAVSQR